MDVSPQEVGLCWIVGAALNAVSLSLNSTNANPLGRLVSASVTNRTLLTGPHFSKSSRNWPSVDSKAKFPTKTEFARSWICSRCLLLIFKFYGTLVIQISKLIYDDIINHGTIAVYNLKEQTNR